MVSTRPTLTAQQITALRSATNWANSQGKDHRYAHWYITETPMVWGRFMPHESAYREWLIAGAEYPVFNTPGANLTHVGGICPLCDRWGFFPWSGRRVRDRKHDRKGTRLPGARSEGYATKPAHNRGRRVRVNTSENPNGIWQQFRRRHRWEGDRRKWCTDCRESCSATGHRCKCCDDLFSVGETILGHTVQRKED